MAGDDDHVVGPLGSALNGHRVTHFGRRRHPPPRHRVAGLERLQAILLQLRLGPAHRRSDAALGIGLRGQGVPSPEAHELFDISAKALLLHLHHCVTDDHFRSRQRRDGKGAGGEQNGGSDE